MRVGILGGGQLALMLAKAGKSLGVECTTFVEEKGSPAATSSTEKVVSFDEPETLFPNLTDIAVVTYEWENIPSDLARQIEKKVPHFYPKPDVLDVVQDRFHQKEFLSHLSIEMAPFIEVPDENTLKEFAKKEGYPVLLKTRLMGYDGKGQWKVACDKDFANIPPGLENLKCIAEKWISFDREVSLVAARSPKGEMVFYPLVENFHREGILRVTRAPAPRMLSQCQKAAEAIAVKIFQKLSYVGVLCIEFFEVQGQLLVNEVASRVHNSGHWSIEGSTASQFENHMRAVLGMPLVEPKLKYPHTAMVNFIGQMPSAEEVKKFPKVAFHFYGKSPRPGRKLGHATVTALESSTLEENIKALLQLPGAG